METNIESFPKFTEEENNALAEIVKRDEWKHIDKMLHWCLNDYARHCLTYIRDDNFPEVRFKQGKYEAVKELIMWFDRIRNPDKYRVNTRVSSTTAGY